MSDKFLLRSLVVMGLVGPSSASFVCQLSLTLGLTFELLVSLGVLKLDSIPRSQDLFYIALIYMLDSRAVVHISTAIILDPSFLSILIHRRLSLDLICILRSGRFPSLFLGYSRYPNW